MSNRTHTTVLFGSAPRHSLGLCVVLGPLAALGAVGWRAVLDGIGSGAIPSVLFWLTLLLVPIVAPVLTMYVRRGAILGVVCGVAFVLGTHIVFWDQSYTIMVNVRGLLVTGGVLGVYLSLIGVAVGVFVARRTSARSARESALTESS